MPKNGFSEKESAASLWKVFTKFRWPDEKFTIAIVTTAAVATAAAATAVAGPAWRKIVGIKAETI